MKTKEVIDKINNLRAIHSELVSLMQFYFNKETQDLGYELIKDSMVKEIKVKNRRTGEIFNLRVFLGIAYSTLLSTHSLSINIYLDRSVIKGCRIRGPRRYSRLNVDGKRILCRVQVSHLPTSVRTTIKKELEFLRNSDLIIALFGGVPLYYVINEAVF